MEALQKEIILFGAGVIGERTWNNLKNHYQIKAYADNDENLWGKTLHGVSIIPPEKIKMYGKIQVVICSDYYNEISVQLLKLNIEDIFIVEPSGYMLYRYTPEKMMIPVNLSVFSIKEKQKRGDYRFLFVQDIPCIRTHKIAHILSEKNIDVSILYTGKNPIYSNPSLSKIYSGIYYLNSIETLLQFVNNGKFDLIHSSNEPDSLTNLLLLTNKKIVHDTHDMMSLCRSIDMNLLSLEYIANVKSHGCLYVNEEYRELALERFNIPKEKTFVIENYPLKKFQPKSRLSKLSLIDGEIHCVYEGGISSDSNFYRFFENVWRKLTSNKIHIHFYSSQLIDYCKELDSSDPYLHYEGELEINELIYQMTQYDCGIILFNITDSCVQHLEKGQPNKLFEYLSAGLPVAVGEIESYKNFVRRYQVGDYLDLSGDIIAQLKRISSIKIKEDFLIENHFIMDSKAKGLLEFYMKIIEG